MPPAVLDLAPVSAGMGTQRPLARHSDGLAAASQSAALKLRRMSPASMAEDTKTDRRRLPRARGAEGPRAGRALTAPGQARVPVVHSAIDRDHRDVALLPGVLVSSPVRDGKVPAGSVSPPEPLVY